jgi:hypothetical protein
MDLLKTPHEKLMENAGIAPQTSGMVNTPQQMLMQEIGGMPHLASGGSSTHPSGMTPQDMLAYLVASGHLPEHYATGGTVQNIATQSALTLPGMGEELSDIGSDIANKKYTSAALKTGAAGYSAFAPLTPLTALLSLMAHSPKAGEGSTLDEWRAAEELRKNPPKEEQNQKKQHSLLYQKTMGFNK